MRTARCLVLAHGQDKAAWTSQGENILPFHNLPSTLGTKSHIGLQIIMPDWSINPPPLSTDPPRLKTHHLNNKQMTKQTVKSSPNEMSPGVRTKNPVRLCGCIYVSDVIERVICNRICLLSGFISATTEGVTCQTAHSYLNLQAARFRCQSCKEGLLLVQVARTH